MVEILPEVGPGLLGMDEAHLLPLRYQVRKNSQERTIADVQVLDVGRPDPKGALDVGDPGKDLLEMGFVCDKTCHLLKAPSPSDSR